MNQQTKEMGSEAIERIKKEYRDSIDYLRRERDEIKLKIHLGNAEIRDQWEEVEKKWEHFQARADVVGKISKDSAKEVGEASKMVGEEIKNTYRKIRDSLGAHH